MLNITVIFGSLLGVAMWEFCHSRREREFPALRRRIGNIGIWVINLVVATFFLEPQALARPRFEALLGINFPTWPIADFGLSFLVGFLLLDLLRYFVHRCEHAVPLFWRYHALHHSDPDFDVTTSVRHHPVQSLITSAVYWFAAILLDIPAFIVLSHTVAAFGLSSVQHGNIRLPEWVERLLQPVLVTVDMHRIHHSVEFHLSNSNYGAVLSVWDRLFGTFTQISRAQHDTIVFGVRELPRRDCLKPSAMLLTPWLLGRATPAGSASQNKSRRPARVTFGAYH